MSAATIAGGHWWMQATRALFALVLLTAAGTSAAFDHSHAAWQSLLAKHVVVEPGRHASRVDYRGFVADRAALDGYLRALSGVSRADYDRWSRPERLAFLVNAYNAFTIAKVLQRYPDLRSIRDFGRFIGNPWKDRFFTLLGEARSLDDIEHRMIRGDRGFDEPRTHFALNCASVGCPMLREEAYVSGALDEQLEDQARRFLSDRQRNRFRAGVLEISSIFDWYGDDFRSARTGTASVAQFLGRYADLLADTAADQALVRDGRARIVYLDYDWALNDLRR